MTEQAQMEATQVQATGAGNDQIERFAGETRAAGEAVAAREALAAGEAAAGDAALIADELLVEEISIDGMCGVY
jgi:mycofactocin precursor